MRITLKAFGLALIGTIAAAHAHAGAAAADYPSRDIRIVVPYAPGGSTDSMARSLAQLLGQSLGRTVVVENRPGAGSVIGTAEVARAKPDGYTLLMSTSALTINPSLMKKVPFDPQKDLEPVVLFASSPNALIVPKALGVNTLQELMDMARQRPGQLNYATSGIGTSIHLGMETFKQMGKLDIMPVHYRGAAPARNDIVAGTVQMMQSNIASALPMIETGKVVPLAVTSAQRSPLLPQVPTIAETGLPGFNVTTWYGILAPKDTPRPIVDKLNQHINAALKQPAFAERLAQLDGASVEGGTPEDFQHYIAQELVRWAEVIRQGNIQAD